MGSSTCDIKQEQIIDFLLVVALKCLIVFERDTKKNSTLEFEIEQTQKSLNFFSSFIKKQFSFSNFFIFCRRAMMRITGTKNGGKLSLKK